MALVRAATPGSVFPAKQTHKEKSVGIEKVKKKYVPRMKAYIPSRSSKLAPPPVLTWLTLDSVFHFAAQVAVSPPPIMVIVPAAVDSTTESITAFVALEKFSNSKTPIGLWFREQGQ